MLSAESEAPGLCFFLVSRVVSQCFVLQDLEYKMLLRTAADSPLSWGIMQDEQADLVVVLQVISARI